MSSEIPALIADITALQEQTARYLARERERGRERKREREQREQKKQRDRDEETLALIRIAEEQHREFVLVCKHLVRTLLSLYQRDSHVRCEITSC